MYEENSTSAQIKEYYLPEPLFAGFHIKPYHPAKAEWTGSYVKEICTTTLCLSGIGYITAFLNPLTFANSLTEAEDAFLDEVHNPGVYGAAPSETVTYYVYAYRVYPLLFTTTGQVASLTLEQLFLGEIPPSDQGVKWHEYNFLGYDVVGMHSKYSAGLGCSPLSCNGMVGEYLEDCNEYCLVKDKAAAYKLALQCGVEEPEPGPYVITQVWRKAYSDKFNYHFKTSGGCATSG